MNIYLFIAKISTLVEDCLLARAAQPVYSLCAAMVARVVGGKVSEGTFSRSSNARPRRRL